MTDEITIRRVHVEFLRAGPPHNQLLSPYTQYLAVCNDAGAAGVTVPYGQRVFEPRLKELWYETGDQSDRSRYTSSTAYPPADRPGIVVSLI